MKTRPRLSIDLTKKQSEFVQKLPFGWRQQIFSILLDMLIDITDNFGSKGLGLIISRKLRLEDYFDIKKEKE